MRFSTLVQVSALVVAASVVLPTIASSESHEDVATTIRQSAIEAGDGAAGEVIFKKCRACHKLGNGAKNGVGPILTNVVGADFGSVEGYKYSKAILELKAEGMIWTLDALDAFLTKPGDFIDKTKMAIAGIKDADDRANLIAFIQIVPAFHHMSFTSFLQLDHHQG